MSNPAAVSLGRIGAMVLMANGFWPASALPMPLPAIPSGDRPFTVMMEQSLKCRRCAEQRHVYFLPHDGYRHVDAFNTRENVGHQIAPLVGFGISPIRHLIVRGAVDVMEDRPRQSPPCHRAEIPDVVASIDTHWLLHL
jgi:hypothetical protein